MNTDSAALSCQNGEVPMASKCREFFSHLKVNFYEEWPCFVAVVIVILSWC